MVGAVSDRRQTARQYGWHSFRQKTESQTGWSVKFQTEDRQPDRMVGAVSDRQPYRIVSTVSDRRQTARQDARRSFRQKTDSQT